ncbi:hypothetical protein [Deinococcus aquiradiocola]|uniref:Uncharacterized protein n=1 Tax=Deinococcus aquiradiocola TaxID=393059 RepID=A0A917UQJ6_9DEIO|nr:hypothetical protein [Deinococcus aquiradiocola]GGJ75759.1 hypothetical protein GCM10008939_19950 [Deinococcus aquiradiocola]
MTAAAPSAVTARVTGAVTRLDAWLQSMRQDGGYGGPVAHYWQNRMLYAGPGLDWRYEGLLVGYHALHVRTRDDVWRQRAILAAEDLRHGQGPDGLYRASRFEINPGTLGTPHEAAASLGLLDALDSLPHSDVYLQVARDNLDAVIAALWDGQGFNDHRSVKGRVPNKLATLAQALLRLADRLGPAGRPYLDLARSALDDVLRYQEPGGEVHQYAPGAGRGDGRYFPFYNARCVEPLLLGAQQLGRPEYARAAERILDLLGRWMNRDGSWPQIVYAGGQRAEYPRWYAGTADILYAQHVGGRTVPDAALARLLDAQLPNGAFPTAEGFSAQVTQRPGHTDPRDLLGVVGWNDKVLRLLAHLVDGPVPAAPAGLPAVQRDAAWLGTPCTFHDDPGGVRVTDRSGHELYRWDRGTVWASQTGQEAELR